MDRKEGLAYRHQEGLFIPAEGHILCFLQALLTHITLILCKSSGQIIHQIKVQRKIIPAMYTHQFVNVKHISTTVIESVPKTWLERGLQWKSTK